MCRDAIHGEDDGDLTGVRQQAGHEHKYLIETRE
jgi:hypothetical protein